MECSNSSLVLASNFPAASLNALGEVVAKDKSCAVVWVVIDVAVDVGGRDVWVGLLDRRREMVGSKTPNNRGPTKNANQHRMNDEKKRNSRCSSNVIENKAANALHTSPTAAACDSTIDPSCIAGAIFATNSIKFGMRSRRHCRRVGLPEEDADINVLAQWAAVSDI